MILVDLEITDYKQFAGTHRFTPTPHGVVAVIGHNGAGKTTLFEAVEWCLFQPGRIKLDDVAPRRGAGPTQVTLTLSDPRTGDVYTVTRRIRKGIGSAEVARGEGDAREVLATTTRAVTDYVARTLVGLDHRAFAATFFTRQKELGFFAGAGKTDRRREVQRLLGLETIRRAQEMLLDERKAANTLAEGLLASVQETTASRDLDAELAAAKAAAEDAGRAVETRRAELQSRERDLQTAQRAYDAQADRKAQDAALAGEAARHAAEREGAARAVADAEAEVVRLQGLAAGRGEVERLAATADTARARVDELDALRQRHDRLRQADRDRDAARRRLADDLAEVERRVAAAPLPTLAGWAWPPVAPADPVVAIDGVLGATSALAVADHERRVALLTAALDQTRQVADAEAEADRFRAQLAALEADRDARYRDGDPVDEIAHLDERTRDLDTRVARDAQTVSFLTDGLADLRELLDRLASPDPSGTCPTCGRPFSAHDAEDAVAHTRARLADQEAHVASLRADVASLAAQRTRYAEARAAAQVRLKEIETFTDRIAKGQGLLDGRHETLARLRRACADTLAELGTTTPPTEADRDAAGSALAAQRAVEQAAVAVRTRRDAVSASLAQIAGAEATRAELGDVAFDPGDLAEARDALAAATSAAARLAEVDRELARLPGLAAARADRAAARDAAEAARADAERRRADLAFDPAALEDARYDRDDASEDQRSAQVRLSAAQVAHTEAVARVAEVERDRARLKEMAARADELARERDTLSQMVDEFNQFDRFVTARVRPQLEDLTSELVRIVTDDKYAEVTLDDDYGVHVRDALTAAEPVELAPSADADGDRFPLDQFSGGERDVVALCARLALSRIIGAQAVNPPRFLVLDEVFGSLDRERRLNLLEMLSNLAGSADVFRQLFVISHIDDVRTSPAFNEVWRVAQHPDGSSTLENLNLTAGSEEL